MRRIDRVALLFGALTVLLTLAARVSAQPPAMSGIARHASTRRPLECLHVALADSLDRTVAHTVTDAAGTFVVVAPDTGTFRVRFIVAGYEPMQGPLIHMSAGMMSEQEYPLSFDDQISSTLEAPHRRPPASIDLGEWKSAGPKGGAPLPRGGRRASEGEVAGAVSSAFDIARVGAEVIIDADGRPRASSWRVIAASQPALAQTARTRFLSARYEPARIGEQPVCELQFFEMRSFRTHSAMGP